LRVEDKGFCSDWTVKKMEISNKNGQGEEEDENDGDNMDENNNELGTEGVRKGDDDNNDKSKEDHECSSSTCKVRKTKSNCNPFNFMTHLYTNFPGIPFLLRAWQR
jgi:hypothetical protein